MITLLMLTISTLSPIVAYTARKELDDRAKAGLILFGIAMMRGALLYAFTYNPD